MRIAIISPSAHDQGHHWPCTEQLATALLATGDDVEIFVAAPPIIAPREEIASRLVVAQTRSRRISASESRKENKGSILSKNREMLACMWTLLKSHQRDSFAVVHFVDARYFFLLILVILSRLNITAYLTGGRGHFRSTPNGSLFGKIRTDLFDYLFSTAFATNRLRFITETDATRLDWSTVAGQNVTVIPYPISPVTNKIDRTTARLKWKIPTDQPIFLLFGTHRQGKDYETVVQAACGMVPRPFLLFAGAVISENDPAKILALYKYHESLTVSRFLTDAETAEVFTASDAVILPYPANYDKGSGVLLEACRFDRPVIATRGGFLEKFIRHFHTGLLYQPNSPVDLQRVLVEFVTAMGTPNVFRAAISEVKTSFSWEVLVQDYRQVFTFSDPACAGKPFTWMR
ncbi:MAG TPA: glycosyltransferase family 4 protein [Chthoniobacterales bacterium]|jgi:glycosyltransferase involved in cell wall biosynthesis